MFDSPGRMLLGLLTGAIFGFLLQKGQVAKFHVIVRQFLLQDFTVLKVMLTAIVVGGIGVYALVEGQLATLHIKPALLGGTIIGGLIFGAAMALLGYCPGTGVAAVAEGSRHAFWGVLGMLLGAGIFAEVFPFLNETVLAFADYGKVTLPDITGIPAWMYFSFLTAFSLALFIVLEHWDRRPQRPRPKAATSVLASFTKEPAPSR